MIDFAESPYALRKHSVEPSARCVRTKSQEGGGIPVTNIVTKSAVLAAACTGSGAFGNERLAPVSKTAVSAAFMPLTHGRVAQVAQLQDRQRWILLANGTSPLAPMAYLATDGRRVSGPSPWRHPA